MAVYPRKLLNADSYGGYKAEPPCIICYSCTADDPCSFTPPLDGAPSDPQKRQMSTILIIMLSILGVVFLILSYLTIYRFRSRIRRRRRNLAAQGLPETRDGFLDNQGRPIVDHHIWYIRTSGLPQSAIDSISIFQFKKGESLIDGSDCAICLNEFEEDDTLRLLPKCGHAFHLPCIDTWLRSHKNCPVCRRLILIGNQSGQDSNEANQVQDDQPLLRPNESPTNPRFGVPGRITTSHTPEDTLPRMFTKMRSRNGNLRVCSDLGDHRENLDQELQAMMRRSISMDSSYASIIYETMCRERPIWDNKHGTRLCKNSTTYRMMKSSSSSSSSSSFYNRSSLQRGPILMKRSFSFGGKRVAKKIHNRSLESIFVQNFTRG